MTPEAIEKLKNDTIAEIIRVEGGYVNDPTDSGGETNMGITVAEARRYGWKGRMRDLPYDVAFRIYDDRFWTKLRLSEVAALSVPIAQEMADTGVNQGTGRAAEFLQRSLNVLNRNGADYADVKVDMDVGPRTLASLRAYLKLRGKNGEVVLHRMLNSLQGAFYVTLAERRQKDEKYVFGWFLNRVV